LADVRAGKRAAPATAIIRLPGRAAGNPQPAGVVGRLPAAEIAGQPVVERHIRLLVPLAFLSPQISRASSTGRHPRASPSRRLLAGCPGSGAEQERRLGCIAIDVPSRQQRPGLSVSWCSTLNLRYHGRPASRPKIASWQRAFMSLL
jgi:hypothetical protein